MNLVTLRLGALIVLILMAQRGLSQQPASKPLISTQPGPSQGTGESAATWRAKWRFRRVLDGFASHPYKRRAVPGPAAAPGPRTSDEDNRLDAYCGKYRYPGWGIVEFRRRGTQLWAQLRGQPAFRVWPAGQDRFKWRDFPAEATFIRDSKGMVIGLVHKQHGETRRAKKLNPSRPAQSTPEGQAVVQPTAVSPNFRTWTDQTGKFRLTASLVQLKDESVVLRTSQGEERHVPLTRLSAKDREYLRQTSPRLSE